MSKIPFSFPIIVVARDKAELEKEIKFLINHFGENTDQYNFIEYGRILAYKPLSESHLRLGFLALNKEECLKKLKLAAEKVAINAETPWEEASITFLPCAMKKRGTAALFAGQGSQYLNMSSEMWKRFEPLKEVFKTMDNLFTEQNLKPLSKIVYTPDTDESDPVILKLGQDKLTQTQFAQPAIGAISVGMYLLMQKLGLKVQFLGGHSFGELSALWAGGVLSKSDYLKLAIKRGQAMAAPDDPNFDAGAMLAVLAKAQEVIKELMLYPDIKLANLNSNNQVVIAGSTKMILEAKSQLRNKGFKVIQLPVSAAFHTSHVKHAHEPFLKALNEIKFNAPKTPVYSNTTGGLYPDEPEDIQTLLGEHILNSVLFKTQIEKMYADGARVFVEFGPKNVLSNLVAEILKGKNVTAIPMDLPSAKGSLNALLNAWLKLKLTGFNIHPPEIKIDKLP